MKIDRDKMNNANVREVSTSCFAFVDTASRLNMKPAVVPMALAATFLLLAERMKVPAQDLFTATKNLMNHADGRRPEFAAAAEYMEKELG